MDDNDLTWPRREPENWFSAQLTREQARNALFDAISDVRELTALTNQLDEAQGKAEGGECFLLIRIVDA